MSRAMESKESFTSYVEIPPSKAASMSSTAFRPRSPFHSSRPSPRRASGSRLSVDHSDYSVLNEPISCVTRKTFQEDCARHRFIVWAAVQRNSSTRMRPEEKLRCPLLRCNQQFRDHETMLRHLTGCEQLASGEYWCHEHMRIERFDDMKCRHCLGHPSKRRKVLSMAKNFFHSLGHRSKRAQGLESNPEDSSLPPPPSYDSISLAPQSDLTELPATQIVEADSQEISTLPSNICLDEAAIDPQQLFVPPVPELGCIGQQRPPLMHWNQTQAVHGPNLTWNTTEDPQMLRSSTRPSLQLNTVGLQGPRQLAPPKQAPTASRTKNLSPSSSLRSNTSTNSNTSTSTSLVSPITNWSWSLESGFNTSLASPVDADDALADNPFTTSGTGHGPVASDINYLHDFYSELPADVPGAGGTGEISSDLLLLSLNGTTSTNPPYPGGTAFDDDLNLNLGDCGVSSAPLCCSEAKSIAVSASDALQAHVDESMVKIQQVPGNRLAEQLQAMPTKAVAAAGLRTLRALLYGNNPPSALEALCFVHVAYAFSMVTFEQHTEELSTNLFLQALSYAQEFPSIDRSVYQQLVSLIWQPPNLGQQLSMTLDRSLAAQGKMPEPTVGLPLKLGPDTLLAVALSFLDKIEISVMLGQPRPAPQELSSDLYATHLVDTNADIMIACVGIHQLQQDYSGAAGLAAKITDIVRSANGGMLFSVRRLEIELMHAGMGCMNALRYYGNYVQDVRVLCDRIYEHHGFSASRRTAYHDHAVSLVENLMSSPQAEEGDSLGATDDVDQFLERLFSCRDQRTQSASEADSSAAITSDHLMTDLLGIPGAQNHNQPIARVVATAPPSNIDNVPSITASEMPPEAEEQYPQDQQQQQRAEPEAPRPPTEADARCELCGYRPRGDPQWFRGSMAKHRKVMHSTEPPKIYKCPFPGCASQYKNRPDNLRQHQIEKGHFVGGDKDGAAAPRRPSKRKKTAVEDGEVGKSGGVSGAN